MCSRKRVFTGGNHDALGTTVDMGRPSLVFLVAVLWAAECAVISTKEPLGSESCKDYGQAFERTFSVPGEVALLECQLDMKYILNSTETPYNITWYDERTGSEIMELEQSVILTKKQIWFLNVTMQHHGKYTCVVRTESECCKQAIWLVVNEMTSENCERPQRALQRLSAHVSDDIACPLRRYFQSVDSPSIQWYKNCKLLQDDETFVSNVDRLFIRKVHFNDAGFYTCKMTFRLRGIVLEMSETIECEVQGEHVHVLISDSTLHRIHQETTNESQTDDGYVLVQTLTLSPVLEEDFYLNFTCMVSSSRGNPTGHITLVPSDPDLSLLIGLLLGFVTFLFVAGVLLCTHFKVELALWVRTVFPFLYKTTDGDGRLYDAYIAYPRVLEGSSEKAEMFAMNTLPQVLEGLYGYKLFILGRDGLPGEAVVDVVQDALSRCRRLLLLYTASSLCSPEAQEWAEQQTGLYSALVENSMSIVLLELEEIREPLLLPHSVRLLRQKQGALQAWKRRKRWAFWDRKSVNRMTSLEPSARFWREVRYHMPVRGKAKKTNWFSL
ncbi:interleukin-1 receptor type 1 [Labeo rohita]|uniref:interleukin-1 receptor type 1 n=1 Tax=Labeo rohita TaxID=84645 RepID=UPI0021E21AF4|nr:interleukin-1 receptor type 1 [Labeo rohita]